MNNKMKKFIVLAASLCLMTAAVSCGKGEVKDFGDGHEITIPAEFKEVKDKKGIYTMRGKKDVSFMLDIAYLKTVCSPECANEYFSRVVFTDGENVRKEVIKGDNYDISVVSMDETGENEGMGYSFYTVSDISYSFHVSAAYPLSEEKAAKECAFKAINSFKFTGDPKTQIPGSTAENEMITIDLGTEWAHAHNEKEGSISLMRAYAEELSECMSYVTFTVNDKDESAKAAAESHYELRADSKNAKDYQYITEPEETEIMGAPAYTVTYTKDTTQLGEIFSQTWFVEKDGKVLNIYLHVNKLDGWEKCHDDFMKLINSAELK